jgi:hypothetical protein
MEDDKDIGKKLLRKRLHDKIDSMRGTRTRTDVHPLENYSVVDTIKELLKDKKTMSVPRLNKKYINLRQEHEPLFNMVLERDISEQELNLLESMITTRENMRSGDVTDNEAKDLVATQAAEIFAPHLLHPAGTPVEQVRHTPVITEASDSDSESV